VITLVLGGARSGKSAVAERLAARAAGPVTYVATAAVDPADADHRARVAAHQARRDPTWTTVEAGPDLPAVLQATPGTVLVDSLGTWVTAHDDMAPDVAALRAALLARVGDAVVVSEEVGLGVHPSSELGRRFRDALGAVNVAVADIADEVLLVVAGRLLAVGGARTGAGPDSSGSEKRCCADGSPRLSARLRGASMRRALAFLTPLGGAATPDARTLSWFPVAGALIGACVGAVWWGAQELWPPAVAAALVIAVDLALTGLLHVDGLADSADGLLPQVPRERRLEIMADPTVGAYGVAVVAVVLLLRFAAFASMEADVLLVAGIWAGSRTAMAVAARAVPYARAEGGLASAFTGGDWRPVGLTGLILAVSLGAFAGGRQSELAVAAGIAASGAVVAFARRRLGGFTGDVLGAAGVVGETAALLVAAASW
jgi:cobalamin 5'-phosphate synthase/cobalamin synthase